MKSQTNTSVIALSWEGGFRPFYHPDPSTVFGEAWVCFPGQGSFQPPQFFFLLLGLSCLLQQLPGKQSSWPCLRSKASAPHLPLNLMTLVPARRCKGYLTFIKRESERKGKGRKGKRRRNEGKMGGGSKVIYHHFLFRQAVIGRMYGLVAEKEAQKLPETNTNRRKKAWGEALLWWWSWYAGVGVPLCFHFRASNQAACLLRMRMKHECVISSFFCFFFPPWSFSGTQGPVCAYRGMQRLLKHAIIGKSGVRKWHLSLTCLKVSSPWAKLAQKELQICCLGWEVAFSVATFQWLGKTSVSKT